MSKTYSTYSTSTTLGPNYGTTYSATYGSQASSSGSCVPHYHFQSTSSFSSIVNTAAYNDISAYMFNDRTPTSSGPVILRDGWGRPGGEGVGEIPDEQPIGEPFILLVFALLYVLFRRIRARI